MVRCLCYDYDGAGLLNQRCCLVLKDCHSYDWVCVIYVLEQLGLVRVAFFLSVSKRLISSNAGRFGKQFMRRMPPNMSVLPLHVGDMGSI